VTGWLSPGGGLSTSVALGAMSSSWAAITS
jgi:hypothetical protein